MRAGLRNRKFNYHGLKINKCEVKHGCGNHAIHYMQPHTHLNVILHWLRLCLHLAMTADCAKRKLYRPIAVGMAIRMAAMLEDMFMRWRKVDSCRWQRW